ncbi:peptide ABC transporter substrate-binding protein, partial [Clostridium perfringens]|nr:peptide ABC transporter substrate-binding protein [Clostridium perfringens]
QDSISSPEVKKALSNKKVRQALSLAIDRKGIVEKVTKAGQVPAYSYVPKGILNSKGEEFASKEYFNPNQANTEEAKKLLAEAGYPNGEGLPTFEFMYNTEGSHKDIAQVIQQDWAKIGVKAELTNQEWKVFLNTRQQGGYQIARHGWNGDYVDPMTFLDMWETGGGNNDAGFSNAEYDKLLADARKETDANRRWELMRKAEDILMDEAPIIPLYYYNKVKGAKPEVKGVRVSMLGHVYFDKAYI